MTYFLYFSLIIMHSCLLHAMEKSEEINTLSERISDIDLSADTQRTSQLVYMVEQSNITGDPQKIREINEYNKHIIVRFDNHLRLIALKKMHPSAWEYPWVLINGRPCFVGSGTGTFEPVYSSDVTNQDQSGIMEE